MDSNRTVLFADIWTWSTIITWTLHLLYFTKLEIELVDVNTSLVQLVFPFPGPKVFSVYTILSVYSFWYAKQVLVEVILYF